jgi:hypothetical protein
MQLTSILTYITISISRDLNFCSLSFLLFYRFFELRICNNNPSLIINRYLIAFNIYAFLAFWHVFLHPSLNKVRYFMVYQHAA